MMRKELPKYPKYKPSGVEWLGEIPEHWELKQLKQAILFQRGHDLPSQDREEGTIPVVSSSGVSGTHCRAAARGPGIITGRYGTIGHFHLVEEAYWPLNTTLYSIDLRGNEPKFLQALLTHLSPLFLLNAVKSAVPGVDRNDIHPLPIALAPLPEQRAIVAFLDVETGKIDRLMGVRRRQIEVLREQRAAVIHHAVTQSLNPTVPMKDSGIEWLGEIPAHWEVRRLKFASRCNMRTLTDKTPPDYELRYIDIGNVNSRGEVLDVQGFTFSSAPSRARRRLSSGSTIISTVRTYLKAIAFFPNPDESLIVSTGFAVLEPVSLLEPQFLFHLLASEYFIQSVIAESKGVGYPAINASDLISIKIAFPAREEQAEILAHIDRETAKADTLIVKYERELALLEEYRSSLISHAVTGKIDVRRVKEQGGRIREEGREIPMAAEDPARYGDVEE